MSAINTVAYVIHLLSVIGMGVVGEDMYAL